MILLPGFKQEIWLGEPGSPKNAGKSLLPVCGPQLRHVETIE
jgi:hypothetical protein